MSVKGLDGGETFHLTGVEKRLHLEDETTEGMFTCPEEAAS